MSEPQTIAQALASLPEEERIILTLHYIKAMSAQEISVLLKVPEKSVHVVIASGRARITAMLGL